MTVRVEHGDCREIVATISTEVDAIITDPPYHLIQIAERSKYPVKYGKDGAMQRRLGGFMNQTWDGGSVAFDLETWRALATVLRPGGFLLAFGGTRTAHRMVCAIEDAGFVIQDTIAWMYGSGFPKRRDMLKPAFEPICVAYKPGGKRTLQVDECRISYDNDVPNPATNPLYRAQNGYANLSGTDANSASWKIRPDHRDERNPQALGRWPANVCHDGSDEVMAAFTAFGDTPGGGDIHRRSSPKTSGIYGAFAGDDDRWCGYGGAGSSARFFYAAKANKQDRWGSRHPTVKPIELIRYLVKLVCPSGGTFLDPFAGSGTAGVAALAEGRNAILIEQDAGYIADIRERLAHYEGEGRHSLASKHRNSVPREQRGSLL